MTQLSGNLRKMQPTLADVVQYKLPVGQQLVPISDYLGKRVTLTYNGIINCVACGRKTNKSFNQGYCYPCMRSLARCDFCILKPEQCHYHKGTCREPQWGEDNCMQPHYVYLANTSGLKVGITRLANVPTRWMDQGAIQALPIIKVNTRRQSGLVEVALANHINDKTNWRKMLQPAEKIARLDLSLSKNQLLEQVAADLQQVKQQFPDDIEILTTNNEYDFVYPTIEFPEKIKSLNFDKTATVGGVLLAIKGQYLIFDSGVINVRKFAGYEVTILN